MVVRYVQNSAFFRKFREKFDFVSAFLFIENEFFFCKWCSCMKTTKIHLWLRKWNIEIFRRKGSCLTLYFMTCRMKNLINFMFSKNLNFMETVLRSICQVFLRVLCSKIELICRYLVFSMMLIKKNVRPSIKNFFNIYVSTIVLNIAIVTFFQQ